MSHFLIALLNKQHNSACNYQLMGGMSAKIEEITYLEGANITIVI